MGLDRSEIKDAVDEASYGGLRDFANIEGLDLELELEIELTVDQ